MLRLLARGNSKNKAWQTIDSGRHMDLAGRIYRIASGEYFVDPQRVLKHPAFAQVEGEGIYTYPFNPDETLNFIYAPARRVETQVVRTITSSVSIRFKESDEDIIVQEIWTGGGTKLSALASMYRTFYNFWLTDLPVGENLTWQPSDLSTETYGVEIVGLELGGVDIQYREWRERKSSTENSLLDKQLTLKLKIARDSLRPKATVTLSGV